MPHLAVSVLEPRRHPLTDETLTAWSATYADCHIDLGTGDGRYARDLARRFPTLAVIGLDTCLDHLKGSARRHPANLRYVTADALTFPVGLLPATRAISINFPYGSLLRGLIEGDSGLLLRLDGLLASEGEMVVRVNASAIEAAGCEPVLAREAVVNALGTLPGVDVSTRNLSQDELRRFPCSWAKRLGHGRPTEAFSVMLTRR
jgi:16S rRNA (adenine(1408)-N(1))-methyltransferase